MGSAINSSGVDLHTKESCKGELPKTGNRTLVIVDNILLYTDSNR